MKKLSMSTTIALEKRCVDKGFVVIVAKIHKPLDKKKKYYCTIRQEVGGKPISVGYASSIQLAKVDACAKALKDNG